MAHQRGMSTADGAKEPHSVSLKVLRLSRPSLSIQHPLPSPSIISPEESNSAFPPASASLAYPSAQKDSFILSPLLTLPPAFGSAYVGETFSCTLCANNELPSNASSATASKTISNLRIEAEMKIPSSGTPLKLVLGPDAHSDAGAQKGSDGEDADEKEPGKEFGADLEPGDSLQRVVNFDLKEEGSHVLAVTVTYTETTPTSGRVRTFRKLYQFVCKGSMVVRTKTGLLPSSPAISDDGKSETGREKARGKKWALEAQLENTGEETITLDTIVLETREGFRSTGLNWEVDGVRAGERPVLMPGDVQQVCFLVEELDGEDNHHNREKGMVDGRLIFGILSLGWRGPMGNRGFLSTGTLGTRLT